MPLGKVSLHEAPRIMGVLTVSKMIEQLSSCFVSMAALHQLQTTQMGRNHHFPLGLQLFLLLLQTSQPCLIHDSRFGLLTTHVISLTVLISLYFAMEDGSGWQRWMQPFLLPEVFLGATAMSQDDFEELMPSLGERMRNLMKYGEPT